MKLDTEVAGQLESAVSQRFLGLIVNFESLCRHICNIFSATNLSSLTADSLLNFSDCDLHFRGRLQHVGQHSIAVKL